MILENYKKVSYYATYWSWGRKEDVMQFGYWIWLHLRINNNAYELEMSHNYITSSTFNWSCLNPFNACLQICGRIIDIQFL